MGYKIGMDFGTTNSTVAYINSNSQHPEAFKFPGPSGYDYIPSCVVYREEDRISIGRAAFDHIDEPEAMFCNNLKMILPMPPPQQQETDWAKTKQPETVISDYFRPILTEPGEDSDSFSKQKGAVEGIVLSVPHVWAKDPAHKGRGALQSIIEGLKCPLIQLISEPVAAAAYFTYTYQQRKQADFSGNLLVCDMGGGTFDVTLCRVQPGKIEEVFNDGNGRTNMGKAGVQFDTNLLTAKGLVENTPEFFEAYRKLQEYKSNNKSDITKSINNVIENPDLLRAKKILRAGRYEFNFDDIDNAFMEIREGIESVMKRVADSIRNKRLKVDKIFFVGGFSEFILVRETIKKALDLDQEGVRLISDLDNEIVCYAIAYGAALIANGLVAVEEKYPHTIGVCANRVVQRGTENLEQEQILLPIIKAGGKLSEYHQPVFSDKAVKTCDKSPLVHIYVHAASQAKPHIRKLPEGLELPNANLPNNSWRVGMRINKSKVVYLIFEDTIHKKQTEYELGDIIRQMFGTLMVEE
jgi:molecular chaperone DnaK